jgi:hypothetical protein
MLEPLWAANIKNCSFTGNHMYMRWPCAATASDDLRAGLVPLFGFISECPWVAGAGPAAMLRVPAFAGIGIDNDRLVGSFAELCDEIGDERWMRAVNSDCDGLRKSRDRTSALTEEFAVSHMLTVSTGEREPGGEFGMGCERLSDGFGFAERGQSFEGEKVRGFRGRRGGEDIDALSMKFDQVIEGAGVVAVVFGAVMECCAVGSERCGDEDTAIGIRCYGLAGERNRAKESSISAPWIEAYFNVAHARDLVTGSFDDVGAGFDVGTMDGDDLFRRRFEDVRGPEGAVDVRAEILEFGGHAAVEDANGAKK